jgi:homogentisate 1,2-dioxygenase
MIERVVMGQVPKKHHLQLRDDQGHLHFEECITQDGFEAPYTIAYHRHAPHRQLPITTQHGWSGRVAAGPRGLLKRHFVSPKLAAGGAALDRRVPVLFNADVTLGIVKPTEADGAYFSNADGDDLFFVQQGGGVLRTVLGDLPFGKDDYVYVPRGIVHRFLPTEGLAQEWLWVEARGSGFHLPRQWRNGVGQLRMDAPFCHRDFRKVSFVGPLDEGLREVVVKRQDTFHGFTVKESPLDVVGWDGTVYPWVFNILDFQPRVGLTHLPPTWHGTFAAKGALVCSFVPRPVDFHPEAIPCPYPHSSVDVDEFIFYCRGNFTSRRGVGPGSMSFHPAGIPHGPHPGAYEASLGTTHTSELAVMLDCALPLEATPAAVGIEDVNYQASFLP